MQKRLTAAGLVLLAVVREAMAACPVVQVPGAWPQAGVHQAISAGKPIVDLPSIALGNTRTVTLEGLCDDAFTLSTGFTCSGAGGEFRATLTPKPPAASPVSLRMGAASCPLTAISIYKTVEKPAPKAEMRLQFEGCVGAPATSGVTSAAVVVEIVKGAAGDANADFNLLPWTKEVCGVDTPDAVVAPVDKVSQETDTKIVPLGVGTCDGKVRKEIKGVKDTTGCKLQCVSSTTQAHILGGVGCSGFAFNADAKGANCITFSGKIEKTKKLAEDGWNCNSLSFTKASYDKKAPAPVVAVVKDTSQILDLKKVLGHSSHGYMQQISPPAAAPTCYSPLWWFTLQDMKGKPLTVPVKSADWDALMKLVPKPESTKSVVDAPIIIDRVIVNTCPQFKSKGWGSQECFVPAVKKTECRQEEITGAIVSGVITAILTWIMVGAVFFVYTKTFRAKGDYESLNEPGQGARFCQTQILVGISLTAVVGALLSCWLSTQFIDAILRSSGCYDFDEFLVVMLAVVLAVSLTIILIIHYMANMHPSHPHPFVADTGKSVKPKSTQLMLVQVEDGKSVGVQLNSFTAEQQGNAFTSFNSAGSGGSPMSSNMGPMSTNTGAK